MSLSHAWNSQVVNQRVHELQLLNDFFTQHFPKDRVVEECLVQRTYDYTRLLKNRYFTHPQNTKSFWELKSELSEFLMHPIIDNRIKQLRLFDAEDLTDFKNRLLLKLHLYCFFLITERKKRRKLKNNLSSL